MESRTAEEIKLYNYWARMVKTKGKTLKCEKEEKS